MSLELVDVGIALSSPVRVDMLHAMGSGPITMKALGYAARATPSAISYHISKLLEAGLVEVNPYGNLRLVNLRAKELRLILAP